MGKPPPTERWAFLRTRFGRRLFVGFASAAMAPILILAALSWFQVGDELHRQSRNRLHQAARASGMRIVEKLDLVEAQLSQDRLEVLSATSRERLNASLLRLLWLRPGSPPTWMIGGSDGLEPESIEAGGTRLVSRDSRNGAAIWLFVPAGEGAGWAAELDPAYLFDHGPTNVLPVAGEFCVEDGGRRLACSFEESLPDFANAREGAPEFESWTVAEEAHLGVRWPLFLRARFSADPWTITVSEPKSVALSAAATFRTLVPPTVLVTLLVVALATIVQIRRRLVPLEQLTERTRKVAEGDFSVDVEVSGDDEFATLGRAFSAMTRRLASQFTSMEQLIEADRRILSCNDPKELLEIAIAALAGLHPAPRLAIHLREGRSEEASVVELVGHEIGHREIVHTVQARNDELLPFRELDARLVPPEIAGDADPALSFAIQFPLTVGSARYGDLFIWLPSREDLDPSRRLIVGQFASQLAAAFHGTSLRAERERLLNFDSATGLPNRTGVATLIDGRIDQLEDDQLVAVAEVSLGGITRMEGISGRDEVTRLIRKLAAAIARECAAETGRTRDDAIVVVFEASDRMAVQSKLRQLGRLLAEELETEDRGHTLSLSTGVAVCPLDGHEAGALLRNARQAGRHAIEQGSSRATFFSDSLRATAEERAEIERDLVHAANREELRVFYQPIVDAQSLEVVAAEALVRWEHPDRGLIPPDQFIPVAEECGLIAGIGSWVLRRTCDDLASWSGLALPEIRVSVNVASAQITAGDLLSEVKSALSVTGISPASLGIELTEGSLLGGDLATSETIAAIRRLGVAVSIDDFGTGYSSLAYLRRLPIDILKLDRSFLDGVPEDSAGSALVGAILAMTQSLGLTSVTEGVETREQLEMLRDAGCDRIQGYLFAPPLPEPAFREFLEKGVDFD